MAPIVPYLTNNSSTSLCVSYSEISDGNMSFKWGKTKEVIKNRTAFLAKHGYQSNQVVTMKCGGSLKVQIASLIHLENGMLDEETAIDAEALITADPFMGLFLITADCVPLTLYDSQTQVRALVHLSRRVLDSQVLRDVIHLLNESFHIPSTRLQALIGPSIKPTSYIFTYPPTLHDNDWSGFIIPKDHKTLQLDLAGFAVHKLKKFGVPGKQIWTDLTDTVQDKRYFSHVRSRLNHEPEGRFATLVHLANKPSTMIQ